MKIVKAKRVAEIARNTEGDWTVRHGRFLAVLPATGPEVDAWVDAGKPLDVPDGPDFGREAPPRVVRMATKVVTRERHKPTEPAGFSHPFLFLDGEEYVDLQPITKHNVMAGRPGHIGTSQEVVVARITCSSPRCVETVTELEPPLGPLAKEVTRQRPWSRLVVWFPDQIETDPRRKPLYAGGVQRNDTDIEGRDPYEVRGEHIAWHRKTFGVHPRVELDRWLAAHPGFGWAPVDREELDYQLSIARAERCES